MKTTTPGNPGPEGAGPTACRRGLQRESGASPARRFSRNGGRGGYGSAGERGAGDEGGSGPLRSPRTRSLTHPPRWRVSWVRHDYYAGPSLVLPSRSASPPLLRTTWKGRFPTFPGLPLLGVGLGEVLWNPLVQNPSPNTEVVLLNPNPPSAEPHSLFIS